MVCSCRSLAPAHAWPRAGGTLYGLQLTISEPFEVEGLVVLADSPTPQTMYISGAGHLALWFCFRSRSRPYLLFHRWHLCFCFICGLVSFSFSKQPFDGTG